MRTVRVCMKVTAVLKKCLSTNSSLCASQPVLIAKYPKGLQVSPRPAPPTKRPAEKHPVGRSRKRRVVEYDIPSDHLEAVEYFQSYEIQVASYWKMVSISVKCHRSTYSEVNCKRVLEFLKLPGASVWEVRKKFNIPKSTVQDMKKRQFLDVQTQSEPCT